MKFDNQISLYFCIATVLNLNIIAALLASIVNQCAIIIIVILFCILQRNIVAVKCKYGFIAAVSVLYTLTDAFAESFGG